MAVRGVAVHPSAPSVTVEAPSISEHLWSHSYVGGKWWLDWETKTKNKEPNMLRPWVTVTCKHHGRTASVLGNPAEPLMLHPVMDQSHFSVRGWAPRPGRWSSINSAAQWELFDKCWIRVHSVFCWACCCCLLCDTELLYLAQTHCQLLFLLFLSSTSAIYWHPTGFILEL